MEYLIENMEYLIGILIIGFCIWFFSTLMSKMIKKGFISIPKIKSEKIEYEKNKQSIKESKPSIKNIGLFITVVGVVFLVLSLNMNTSVLSQYGMAVNNIGLMNEKQNYIIVSCFVILIGILISLFSRER